LELFAEPDLLLDALSAENLPVRLELPEGNAGLNIIHGGRRTKVLSWNLQRSGE